MNNNVIFSFLAAGYLLFGPAIRARRVVKYTGTDEKMFNPASEIKLNNNLVAFPRIQINDTGQKAPMIIVLHGRNGDELSLQKYIPKNLPARVFFIRGQIPTDSGNLFYLNRLKDDPNIVGPQIKAAGKILNTGIETLLKKYPTNKLIIFGFSQGAGLALHMGSVSKADSIISLAGSLPSNLYPSQSFDTKISMWHGRKDKTVPFDLADNTYKYLYNKGFDVDFEIGENKYHSVAAPEIIDKFLKEALND